MNLPWEQEAGKALRAAQAVLALPDIAWFDAASPAPELLDPTATMESMFSQLLGGDSEPTSNAAIEPQAPGPVRGREPHGGPREPTAGSAPQPGPSAAPARRIVRDPHARSPVSVRVHRPIARDDPGGSFHDTGVAERRWLSDDATGAASRQRQQAEPMRAASREHMAEAMIPPMEPTSLRDASALVQGHHSTAAEAEEDHHASTAAEDHHASTPAQDHLGRDGIRGGPARTNPETFRGTARPGGEQRAAARGDGSREAGNPSNPPDATRSTRLVTGLADLNHLFRSVVADSQSRYASEPVRSTEETEGDSSHAGRAQSSRRGQAVQPDSFPAGPSGDHAHAASSAKPLSAHTGRQVALRADTSVASAPFLMDAPFASFTGTPPVPDPAREDVLFDRLLDRLEERLREQALRHLGFTGGLT